MFKCCYCAFLRGKVILYELKLSFLMMQLFFLINNLKMCTSKTSSPQCVFVHFNTFSYDQDLFALLCYYQELLLPLPANILPQIALVLLASLLLCLNCRIMIMEHHDRG